MKIFGTLRLFHIGAGVYAIPNMAEFGNCVRIMSLTVEE
jgi:hypothetical protein